MSTPKRMVVPTDSLVASAPGSTKTQWVKNPEIGLELDHTRTSDIAGQFGVGACILRTKISVIDQNKLPECEGKNVVP